MGNPETHSESRRSPVAILIVFGIVMAFLGYEMLQFKRAGKQVHGAEITVFPAMLKMHPGESHTLEASVVGIENVDVRWSVEEGPAGGSVISQPSSSHDGRMYATTKYTAPLKEGLYHVTATSAADGTRSSTATMVVTQK